MAERIVEYGPIGSTETKHGPTDMKYTRGVSIRLCYSYDVGDCGERSRIPENIKTKLVRLLDTWAGMIRGLIWHRATIC